MTKEDLIIKETQPKMKVHEFTEKFMEHSIIFRVIVMKNSNADIEDAKLEDCAWIWVGTPSCPEFKVLSVALNTRYSKKPIGTDVIGWHSGADRVSRIMAERLAIKFKKAVFYVSYNLDNEMSLQSFVENCIHRQLIDIFPSRGKSKT